MCAAADPAAVAQAADAPADASPAAASSTAALSTSTQAAAAIAPPVASVASVAPVAPVAPVAAAAAANSPAPPALTLIYMTNFDLEGRAQWQRLALIISGIEFNDVRISRDEFEAMKAAGELPFGRVPVLVVEGHRIGQSNAIARYIGKFGGLYPSDFLQAMLVDEILEQVTDVINMATPLVLYPMTDEQKDAEHERLWIEGSLMENLGYFEKELQASGTDFFVGSQLTLADLAVLSLLCWPAFPGSTWTALPDRLRTRFPLLNAHYVMIGAIPEVHGQLTAWESLPILDCRKCCIG